jgi:hypothetical protein
MPSGGEIARGKRRALHKTVAEVKASRPGDHKVQACSLGLMGDHAARVARRALDEELLHD